VQQNDIKNEKEVMYMEDINDFDIRVIQPDSEKREYEIRVSYKTDTYHFVKEYAKRSRIYLMFGIGDNLEDCVKKKTVKAINELKYLRKINEEPQKLTELARLHARTYLKGVLDNANEKTGN
jgi:tRNA G10  N-methylase Trm11